MEKYAYIRVSSRDQNVDRQVEAMKKAGIKKSNMFIDKQSGKDFQRENYQKMLRKIKSNDVVYVKSIDRLGRNYDEIIQQWNTITKEKNVDIVVLDFPLLNTQEKINGLTGKFVADLILQILSYVAQIERENIHQRQREGIAIAQEKGVRFGRPRAETPGHFEEVYEKCKANEISIREAARLTQVSNHTFKRWMLDYEKNELLNE